MLPPVGDRRSGSECQPTRVKCPSTEWSARSPSAPARKRVAYRSSESACSRSLAALASALRAISSAEAPALVSGARLIRGCGAWVANGLLVRQAALFRASVSVGRLGRDCTGRARVGEAVRTRIARASASTQPMMVQPARKFVQKTTSGLATFRRAATMVGTKYKNTMKTKSSSAPPGFAAPSTVGIPSPFFPLSAVVEPPCSIPAKSVCNRGSQR